MRVMVTGGRDWTDEPSIRSTLAALVSSGPRVLIHGDCDGADKMAARVAASLGWTVVAYPANWATLGDDAGPVRNHQMIDTKPDLVVAFPTKGSRGTWHAVALARESGIRTIVVREAER